MFKINYYRLPFQLVILAIAIFALLMPLFTSTTNPDVEAFCPFGGLQATLGYLITNSLACSMTTRQITLGGMLILGVILAGKLFCSYVCPIGTLSGWMSQFGKAKKINWIPPFFMDLGLRIIKYALLFATFYFTISSSELFCKNYDPYFAMMSSDSGDILWITASISLFFVFILPIFITNFWCKYICPLGAISNIFKMLPIWLPAILLIYVLQYFGVFSPRWTVVLGIIIFLAFWAEILLRRSFSIMGLQVVRNSTSCINCKKCDKNCPMNIKVSNETTVQHIDCHLCGECITNCPEKNTLSFNKKKLRWVPSVVVILLISSGLLISAFTEIPTINQQWGKPEQMERSHSFKMENLKSIKCFGSSTSFATQLRDIKGVVGVSCFAGIHSALISFDPKITSARLIKEMIFEPVTRIISFPNENSPTVDVVRLGIDHFFDPGDAEFLLERFADKKGIYAFSTSFGEPVMTTIYYNHLQIPLNELISTINMQDYRLIQKGNVTAQETKFKTTPVSVNQEMTSNQMIDQLYPSIDIALNDKETYKKEQIKTLILDFQQSVLNNNFNRIPHLMSHLSVNKGILNFKAISEQGKPKLIIEYIETQTNQTQILAMLNQPDLSVYMEDGTKTSIKNPFHF